jgi:hypothetical protein
MLFKPFVISSPKVTIVKIKIACFVIFVIFGVVACASKDQENSQIILPDPDLYTQKFSNINSDNILHLEQVDVFRMDHDENTKLVLRYVLGSNKVFTCCSKSNEIFVWDTLSKSILNKHTISDSHVFPYEFDMTGKLLLGKIEASSNDVEQDNFGLFIWDSTTGKINNCIWANCGLKPMYDYEISGATLQSEGKLVIEFDSYGYFLYDVRRDSFILNSELNCPDCAYWWQIGSIAYDTVNDRYAIVFQEGRIQMYYLDWTTSPAPYVTDSFVVNKGVEGDLQTVYVAKFDISGKYLAIARGNRLKILEMKEKNAQEKFDIEINNITDLIFDQTGRFIFVASDDHLYIFDMETGELVGTYNTPNIIQLDISLDNRLVLWGEKEGQIHIWGVLK